MNTAELDRRGKSARGLEIRQQGRLASQTERSYRNKFIHLLDLGPTVLPYLNRDDRDLSPTFLDLQGVSTRM